MLLDPSDWSPAQCSDLVLCRLPAELRERASPETHAAVIEIASGIHVDVAGAVAELSALRRRLALELRSLGLAAASAGLHPVGSRGATRTSGADRYRRLAESLRFLALRDPTLALHVHVGVPDPEDAIRVLNRLRETVPLLLALTANSPFCHGLDSGFASARTAIFGAFPHTGTPRAFSCYDDYVEAIDVLIATGAVPDPTFLWWDVRLQPALGTVEVRVMDAQSSVADSAAVIALIQSLARRELEGESAGRWVSPDVLAENRFRAARDGMDAWLIDPSSRTLAPVGTLVEELLRECRPHAPALGCSAELESVSRLARSNGAQRQRACVSAGDDLPSMLSTLAEQFAPRREPARDPRHQY